MQKIVTFLWFETEAAEAAEFYTSLFEDSKVTEVTRYGEDAGPHSQPAGSVMAVNFQLAGQQFTALNGGPQFKFNEAVSLYVNCETQQEIDDLWSKLTADGGEEGPCGWLKDKYGLSWQIVPTALPEMISGSDPAVSKRVMERMFKMTKLDIAALEAAHAG